MSADADTGQDFTQQLADVLRLYVGEPHEGKRFTRAALADASGINPSSLKGYIRGETGIPAHALLRLLTVLPVEAGNMPIRRTGYKLAPIEPDTDDWGGIGAEASMLTFEIFEAERDGFVDHRERAKLKRRCASLSAKLDGVQ